jgi:hypothetical protein
MCGEELGKLDARAGKAFYDTGHLELRAEASYRRLDSAIRERDLTRARAAIDEISYESVYRTDADRALRALDIELSAKKSETHRLRE